MTNRDPGIGVHDDPVHDIGLGSITLDIMTWHPGWTVGPP